MLILIRLFGVILSEAKDPGKVDAACALPSFSTSRSVRFNLTATNLDFETVRNRKKSKTPRHCCLRSSEHF